MGFCGAQHIDSVQQRLVVDLRLVAPVAEALIGDLEREVLGHLAFVDHAAGALADLPRVGVLELAARPVDHLLDLLEVFLAQREQLLALARALGRDGGVAAHHQPLAGELRR